MMFLLPFIMYLNNKLLATILGKLKICDIFQGHASISFHVKNQNHFAKIKATKYYSTVSQSSNFGKIKKKQYNWIINS